jgi:hypothetical protein
MNFKEKLPQNAGNRISEVLDFKISRGRIASDPPTSARFRFSASVNKTSGSAPVMHTFLHFVHGKFTEQKKNYTLGLIFDFDVNIYSYSLRLSKIDPA